MMRRCALAAIPQPALARVAATRAASAAAAADRVKAKRPRASKSASAAGGESTAATGRLLRGFQLQPILDDLKSHDVVLAKQEGPSLYSFVAWAGLGPREVAQKLLDVPQADRHVHTVFGRTKTPVDIVLDLDFDHCLEPKSSAKYFTGEGVVLSAIDVARDFFVNKLKASPPEDIVVLDGNSAKKHTYHVHIRSNDFAFADFHAVRDLAADVAAELPTNAVDMGVYRENATMRLAYTPKYTERSRSLLPLKAKDAALRTILKPMHSEMSELDIMERSLVVRGPLDLHATKLVQRRGGSKQVEYDEHGNSVPAFLKESKKWARFGEAVAAVKRLPSTAAEEYATWIRVGLALHSFGNDAHIKAHWDAFSMRSPHKFNAEVNKGLWEYFGSRPNCFNWRRGYNYLVHTLRRQQRQ